jgi:hypothetical protein
MTRRDDDPFKPLPPTRRATDLFIAIGFAGLSGFCWLAVFRVVDEAPVVAVFYAACALMITCAAVGIIRLLVLNRLSKRRRQIRPKRQGPWP